MILLMKTLFLCVMLKLVALIVILSFYCYAAFFLFPLNRRPPVAFFSKTQFLYHKAILRRKSLLLVFTCHCIKFFYEVVKLQLNSISSFSFY